MLVGLGDDFEKFSDLCVVNPHLTQRSSCTLIGRLSTLTGYWRVSADLCEDGDSSFPSALCQLRQCHLLCLSSEGV